MSWFTLWRRLGVSPDRMPPLDPLVQAYQSSSRRYHNLNHIIQCLTELEAIRNGCANPDEVELAIWYHDVIYDATKHDNEEQSAERAAIAMREAGSEPAVIDRVTALILATKHASTPAPGDEQIIVDIDLSILGRPPAEFDAYEQAIREEYSFVDDAGFRAGRSAILWKFLGRDVIFSTEGMRDKYETAARANVKRSLEKLAE